MLLFARATPDRARLLPRVTTGAKVRRGANVKVWGTLDGTTARIVLLNKGARAGGTVEVKAHGDGATLERLTAPSMNSISGVTLAGQSIPDLSRDGKLTGSPSAEPVTPKRGVYRFTLPAASAALLTIPAVR
jgi:hypothetical protein